MIGGTPPSFWTLPRNRPGITSPLNHRAGIGFAPTIPTYVVPLDNIWSGSGFEPADRIALNAEITSRGLASESSTIR